ncbi:hypothetical protein HD598_002144 [Neomicrococcus aestuarii]|uniref:Uncharacterized protein n=1 Tax=Neomicrococcus aestuarii TaxID=556325 RepID=A0A7W8X0P9_9MICC|nr:hypothetical protein [Neomicrococcus aestuarii]MBB5513457.1 hypothetical protein [Neomicrococcus aestuarii]
MSEPTCNLDIVPSIPERHDAPSFFKRLDNAVREIEAMKLKSEAEMMKLRNLEES